MDTGLLLWLMVVVMVMVLVVVMVDGDEDEHVYEEDWQYHWDTENDPTGGMDEDEEVDGQ